MKSFKQFFLESIESEANLLSPPEKFTVPPQKSKFQLGDVVLVQTPPLSDENYIKRNMPKYLHDYTNAIGRVIGHRIIGGGSSYASTEFALQFEDGKISKVKSHLLVGPFRSFQSAKKYQGRKQLTSTDIDPQDHKRFAEASSEIESNQAIEDAFKRLFVKPGEFEWLDEPVSFGYEKFRIVILAFKKVDDHTFWHYIPAGFPEEYSNGQIFYKVVDPISNKLVKTSTFVDTNVGAQYGMITPSESLRSVQFTNGKITSTSIHYFKVPVAGPKALQNIYNDTQKIERLLKIKDGMEFFDITNNVITKGNLKFVPANKHNYHGIVLIPANITTDINAFQNYIFEGGLSTYCVVNNQFVFPKEVKGVSCAAKTTTPKTVIENLNNFPKVSDACEISIEAPAKSYAGLPKILTTPTLTLEGALSLKDFPETILGHCVFVNIESFKGGEKTTISGSLYVNNNNSGPENLHLISYKEIPKAEEYQWRHKSNEEIEKIKQWVKMRDKMLNKIADTLGDDADAFDDF